MVIAVNFTISRHPFFKLQFTGTNFQSLYINVLFVLEI